jgi:SAM-dependent methyltransferase
LKDHIDFSDLPQDCYPALILTGERTLPGLKEENYWFQRHLVAYEYLLPLVVGKRVADLGSGEGYGTDLLAQKASQAVGVELAPEAIFHARNTYRQANLSFLYMDIFNMDLEDDSFDLVCSLQVLEHLHQPEKFMSEARRILRPGGSCFITTPNRLLISQGSDKPINPFHIFEFDDGEFLDFMHGYFDEVEMLGVFHAGKLKLHDSICRRNFSQFCLRLPRGLDKSFYQRFFIPSIKTRDFRISGQDLEHALDFIAVGRKPLEVGAL